MGPRWKGKGAEVKALADPISEIVIQLQSSLICSNSRGLLSDTNVLLKADTEQTELLNRACFGRPRVTTEKNEQWFQLCMEEAFYLQYSLKCIKVVDHNDTELNSDESGCCKPPTECGYTCMNEIVRSSGGGLVRGDPGCVRWNNDQQQLYYNCNSCKAGVLASLSYYLCLAFLSY
ncbi:PREDICTED: tRNA-splicing endonuclease subunit Sen2-1-like isoform X2 [Nicotiana attenuata]|uniref:tRNA-splicing endonuclease subunit Sen2-1-like isoform X2 n=1 Tax=Nicotiana attenuata TaxID=49451 RepID=UPI0009053A5B|nr:PREDICTED: tRNA-splicing endonuclease subunit Sen2-1-like isoform X2 [Nicotiana attenuata]